MADKGRLTWDQVQQLFNTYWGRPLNLGNQAEAAGAQWWIGRPIEQLTSALGTPKPAAAAAPAAPKVETDPIVRASTMGPTQYTPAIRANMDLDTPKGGPFQTSGMTEGVPDWTGYTPRPVRADPVEQLLSAYVAPVQPKAAAAPAPAPKVATAPAPVKKPVSTGMPVQPNQQLYAAGAYGNNAPRLVKRNPGGVNAR